jgi:23S rRNA pseudouridine955/2504/2580 synthase
MRSFKINDKNKYINMNIFKAISLEFPNITLGNLQKLFRLRDIKVNSVRVNKEYILKNGDLVEVFGTDEILFNIPKEVLIVYEDENILVALKPKGIESCNNTHIYDGSNAIYFEQLLRVKLNKNLYICHRLDTNTEGLLIFAKTESVLNLMVSAFKNHEITKKYLAFSYGKFEKTHDILNDYLVKLDNRVKIYKTPVKNSVEIKTEYQVLEYVKAKNMSRVEVTLHTGKTHQIRAHLAFIGHPIIGDGKYCTNEINKKFNLKTQALFAYSYSFKFKNTSPLHYLNNVVITLPYIPSI